MSDPFVGEMRIWPGTFAPTGWFFCDGTTKPISSFEMLFLLLGTTYGGDGVNSFAVPNMQGRIPLHTGQGTGLTNRPLGSNGGTDTVTLTTAQIPSHNHPWIATSAQATATTPANTLLLASAQPKSQIQWYQTVGHGEAIVQLAANAIPNSGGSNLPHNNDMPTMYLNYIICYAGIFPTRT